MREDNIIEFYKLNIEKKREVNIILRNKMYLNIIFLNDTISEGVILYIGFN